MYLGEQPMAENVGNEERRSFRESWKNFDKKFTDLVRKTGPIVSLGASGLYFAIGMIYSKLEEWDKATFYILIAGLALGLAVAIPVFVKETKSEQKD